MKYVKVLLIVVIVLLVTACKNKQTDAIKFKNEYESLNGKKINGHVVKNIKISKDNPIKYSSYDEVLDIIKNKLHVLIISGRHCWPFFI